MTQINAAANTAQSKPLNRAHTEGSCSEYSPFSAFSLYLQAVDKARQRYWKVKAEAKVEGGKDSEA
jgi:hypothetical protein